VADPTMWLTTSEAAERGGVTASQIRRLCEAGKIRSVKRGYTWFIDPDDLQRWISEEKGRRKRSAKAE
jgi:excisionase family DNA binding protein